MPPLPDLLSQHSPSGWKRTYLKSSVDATLRLSFKRGSHHSLVSGDVFSMTEAEKLQHTMGSHKKHTSLFFLLIRILVMTNATETFGLKKKPVIAYQNSW